MKVGYFEEFKYILSTYSFDAFSGGNERKDMKFTGRCPFHFSICTAECCSGGTVCMCSSPFSSANCLASSYVTSLCASRSALFPMRMITCGRTEQTEVRRLPHAAGLVRLRSEVRLSVPLRKSAVTKPVVAQLGGCGERRRRTLPPGAAAM